jgi:hypothetical protein
MGGTYDQGTGTWTNPGDKPKPDNNGVVSPDSIYTGPIGGGGPWDYASLFTINNAWGEGKPVDVWENMNHGVGVGGKPPSASIVYWTLEKPGGPATPFPYTIYCTSCVKKDKK